MKAQLGKEKELASGQSVSQIFMEGSIHQWAMELLACWLLVISRGERGKEGTSQVLFS